MPAAAQGQNSTGTASDEGGRTHSLSRAPQQQHVQNLPAVHFLNACPAPINGLAALPIGNMTRTPKFARPWHDFCFSLFPCACPFICRLPCLSCLSVCTPVCFSASLSDCWSVPVCPSDPPSVCCLPTCLSVCLSVTYLSASLLTA